MESVERKLIWWLSWINIENTQHHSKKMSLILKFSVSDMLKTSTNQCSVITYLPFRHVDVDVVSDFEFVSSMRNIFQVSFGSPTMSTQLSVRQNDWWVIQSIDRNYGESVSSVYNITFKGVHLCCCSFVVMAVDKFKTRRRGRFTSLFAQFPFVFLFSKLSTYYSCEVSGWTKRVSVTVIVILWEIEKLWNMFHSQH